MSANFKQTNAKEHKSSTGDSADAMGLATIAYVDESIRMAANSSYLIAATVLMRDGQLAPFEALFQRGARKLHWRDVPLPLRK